MADDIITIAEIDLEADKAIADIVKLREKMAALKKTADEYKGTQDENTAAHVRAQAEYKNVQTELRKKETILKKVITVEDQQRGTLEKLEIQNAKLRAEQKKLDLTRKDGIKRNKEIVKQIDANTKAQQKYSDQFVVAKRNVGNYTNSLESLSPAMAQATGAARNLGGAFKILLGPIGLVVAAFAAIISYFKRSEEGANKLNKIMAVFTTVLGNFLDVADKLGETLVNAFTKPKETIGNLKTTFISFFEEIKTYTGAALDLLVGNFEKAGANITLGWLKVKGLFSDTSEEVTAANEKIVAANEKITESTNVFKDAAVNAYNGAKESLTGFIDEQKKEIAIAAALADQQAALDKKIRVSKVETSQEQIRLAEIRNELNDKENNDAQKRLKLIDEENAILEQQQERLQGIAIEKYNMKVAQNALSASTKEDLDEEAQLLAEINNIEAGLIARRRLSVSKRVEAEKEIRAEAAKTAQNQAEASVFAMEYELQMWELKNKSKLESSETLNDEIVNAELERINTVANAEMEIIQAQFENKLISQEEYNKQKLELELQSEAEIATLKNEYAEQQKALKIEGERADYENKQILAQENFFTELENEKQNLALQKEAEIESAKATGADIELINKKYAKADKEIEQAKVNAKLSLAGDFAANIATIAGENTKVGKAAASAAVAINTYQAAMGAYASLASIPYVGPFLGIAAAGAATAAGLASIKKIWAVDAKGASSVSSASSASSASSPAVSAPTIAASGEVGAGIVSRDNQASTVTQPTTTVAVVVDDVTAAQNVQSDTVQASVV